MSLIGTALGAYATDNSIIPNVIVVLVAAPVGLVVGGVIGASIANKISDKNPSLAAELMLLCPLAGVFATTYLGASYVDPSSAVVVAACATVGLFLFPR